jgi:hypothetical protein
VSSRWKKKNAPQVGQVWRHNMYLPDARPIYLVLDEARMSMACWELDLLNLETGKLRRVTVKRDHETWERIV